eukprot:TRINITY_DN22333_c0_g1_i1.p1 TRINITY_DN22333_c0_g1~~TRINITY_DN22333_c0_g1_i1.p1  ORF type:complete len:324 (+),score=105.84 TRINITY_DN22333_c0_g1_i1:166-1137(+)
MLRSLVGSEMCIRDSPLTRTLSVLNRYIPRQGADGDVQYIEDDSRGYRPGHIKQDKDGQLESHDLLDHWTDPDPPEEWDQAAPPMDLTLAFGLGNGRAQVILPNDEMTVWQALQKVEDTIRQTGFTLEPTELQKLRKLKFSISVNSEVGSSNYYNPNLRQKPRWSPAQVQAKFDAKPPELTKGQLLDEMQKIATAEWLERNGMTKTGSNRAKKNKAASLIERYRYLCDSPLVAQKQITAQTVKTLSGLQNCMARTSLEAVRLIGTLHNGLRDRIGHHLWLNAKLNNLLDEQLDDALSVLTMALPDWCFAVSYTHLTLPTKRIV